MGYGCPAVQHTSGVRPVLVGPMHSVGWGLRLRPDGASWHRSAHGFPVALPIARSASAVAGENAQTVPALALEAVDGLLCFGLRVRERSLRRLRAFQSKVDCFVLEDVVELRGHRRGRKAAAVLEQEREELYDSVELVAGGLVY